MSDTGFRPDDEALLRRLQDDALAAELWSNELLGDAPCPPRLGALVHELRALPSWTALPTASHAEEREALDRSLAVLLPAGVSTPPRVLHQAALFFSALGAAHLALGRTSEAWPRALACWLALEREGTYLHQLAARSAGPSLGEANVRLVVRRVTRSPFERLEASATAGATSLSASGMAALRTLTTLPGAARLAGLGEASVRAELEREAAAAAARIAESALAPLEVELDELAAEEDGFRRFAPVGARLCEAWEWTGREVAVEHAVVKRTLPFAWRAHAQPGLHPLATVMRPVRSVVDHFAARLDKPVDERTTAELAYASECADALVFLAMSEKVWGHGPGYVTRLRQAVSICPTHRNGRNLLKAAEGSAR